MNVTEKEINKFIGLFWREDYERVCDFLSSKTLFGIYTQMIENRSGGYIIAGDSSGHYIRLNSWINKKDIDFVLSFISRYFENFKLIFSSSIIHIFVATTENMQATLCKTSYIDSDGTAVKLLDVDLFSHGDSFARIYLSEYDSDVSDELWNIILNCSDNSARILSAYTSGNYVFTEKIGKRINDLYESLPDSDKLLLELGEDI